MIQEASRGAIAPPRTSRPFPAHVIPAVLVLYACLLPREFTFEIADISMQPYRVVLVLIMPYVLSQWSVQRLRFNFVDFLTVFSAIWIFLALTVVESFESALVTGLSDGLNLALAYFAGRVAIRNSDDFRRFLYAVLPGLFLCALLLATESITHTQILRPMVASVTGVYGFYPYETRLGLMRAQGPFPHAILGGVFMASFLPLIWYVVEKPFARTVGLVSVAGFIFSLSSTGFLGIIVGGGLILTSYLQRVTKLPVFPAAIGGMLFMMVVISVFSQGGLFVWIIHHLTFSSGTGYYRMSIWTYGGAEVMRHPIFGIGTRSYTRPYWMISPSVDAHWLYMTMRYGFPAGMSLLFSMIISAAMALRGAWSPFSLDRKVGLAIGFSLISIIFTGLSVYLWEGMGIWMTLLTGMGVGFGARMTKAVRAVGKPVERTRPRLTPQAA